MYRHLLVPIDQSDVSIEAVGNAVGLAHAVGARITFFHAVQGSLLPPQREDLAVCQATELLAKAEAAARALGVPCASQQVFSDGPAPAIVEAARASGCDLVFMSAKAPGAESGEAQPLKTIGAVVNGGLQVLVSCAGKPGPSTRAIAIIRDEHRALAAVLHAWMHALATASGAGVAADAQAMRAIVRYLELYTLVLHDPKEDERLFSRLRIRTSDFDAELDELQRQHLRQRQRVAHLAQCVEALTAASGEAAVIATRDLDDAVRKFAPVVWEHLGREEGVILPAAQRHLSAGDWSDIHAAFATNHKQAADAAADVGQLLARMATAVQPRG